MNTDQNLIFEAYYNNILSEAPISAEYEPFAAATKGAIAGRAGDTYLFSDLIKKTGKSADEVVEMIVKPVYDALFPGGRFDAEGSEKDQLNSLQTAIHSELVHLGYPKARAGYTARIIKNAITPAVKFLSDKAAEGEDVNHQDVEDAVVDSIETTDTQSSQELKAAPAQHGNKSEKAPEVDKLEHFTVNAVSDGTNEQDLVNTIKAHIVQGNMDISEVRAVGQAKGVINKLLKAKVLSKRGALIELGDNAEDFTSGEADLADLTSDEYAQREFGVNARPTTGRQVFGGEGGRYGVDFG
jgi:hypothetical protein